jgi:hypothetical protein
MDNHVLYARFRNSDANRDAWVVADVVECRTETRKPKGLMTREPVTNQPEERFDSHAVEEAQKHEQKDQVP